MVLVSWFLSATFTVPRKSPTAKVRRDINSQYFSTFLSSVLTFHNVEEREYAGHEPLGVINVQKTFTLSYNKPTLTGRIKKMFTLNNMKIHKFIILKMFSVL